MSMSSPKWNGETGKRWVASQTLLDAILRPYADALIEAAALPESGTVVDVGCGCGATTLMAARSRPRVQVTGVDVSTSMLERARERAAAQGLNVRFEYGDAGVVERPAASVDRVLSRFGVMFFDDPVAAFTNMRRWLAPGGAFVAMVWGPIADNPWMTEVIARVRRHVEVPEPDSSRGPFSLAEPPQVERLLEDAGFARHEQRWVDLPMRIPGPVEDAVRFHRERSIVLSALDGVAAITRDAVHEELRAFVEAGHDGAALTLGARARLVRAWA